MLLEEEKTEKKIEKTKTKKKYIAVANIKITCDKEYNLLENQEISKDIPEKFIESLLNSNLIKEV